MDEECASINKKHLSYNILDQQSPFIYLLNIITHEHNGSHYDKYRINVHRDHCAMGGHSLPIFIV